MNEPEQSPTPAGHGPPPLVFIAVAVGGLGIGFGIAATVLMVKSRSAGPAASASVREAPPPAPPPPEPRGPWLSELHADVCAAPCCGGTACAVSSDNSGKASCRSGAEQCERCASGITCLPGSCSEKLGAGEALGLHVSGVIERSPSGELLDACKTQRDLWLCVRTEQAREWQCLSQREACANEQRSPAAVALSSDDLVRHGVEVEVREGAPDGKVLAHKSRALYPSGLTRRGFCSGFRMDLDAQEVVAFTFFLDRAPSADAPQPVRLPYAPKPEDAGVTGQVLPVAAGAALELASSPLSLPSARAPESP